MKHIGIIMDGNRRWARARGLPEAAGHRAGLERLAELVPAIAGTGAEMLTVYAFACANWSRSRTEVEHLFRLAREGLCRFVPECRREGVRVEVIGRRDRLPGGLLESIERAEAATRAGSRVLRIALDYSGRDALLAATRAAVAAGEQPLDHADFGALLNRSQHARAPYLDLDLVIRTGRERRLSDFLLYECAYAELYFSDLYWPEFTPEELTRAIDCYHTRLRRFGG